ncbi:hypothetical protein SAMN05216268_106364 [Streptomyces yunnanensis]|uniref:Uncharacterized protein n=1 Tax=Streptomyces yunnanensis TaxID=156453 RepID=A0A9X8MU78_9ACTN|nr:hypothetical protein SAMN05216268_106364 [Streptomyces yunnanensis]
MNDVGKPCAGEPHARCEAAGAGNGAEATEPVLDRTQITAELGCLAKPVVLSTGCMTGNDAMARSFLDGGCSACVAPRGYPDGTAAFAFAAAFYCQTLALRASPPEAVAIARTLGGDTNLFNLWH